MVAVTTLGLGKTMERKLHTVGIHSAEELKDIGGKQAVFRLKAQYPNTCVCYTVSFRGRHTGC